MITITGYNWVPDFAKGQVRDLRIRWALEEAGLAYSVKLIDHSEKLTEAYRAWQPFSQVPAYKDDAVELFESGAILMHIAERSEILLPKDPASRARAIVWILAALNSVEPFIRSLLEIDLFNPDAAWAKERRPQAEANLKKRLEDLAQWLKDREWLEDRFTAGDLMMAMVLRELNHTDLVTAHPILGPYVARCTARPAFRKALKDQLASFDDSKAPPQFRVPAR